MQKKLLQKGSTYTTGFTLIETLVAITILMLAIVGPMTIASRGLHSAFFAKDQFTAVYLAQEAMELARAVRDGNALEGGSTDWLAGFGTNCKNANGCRVDVRSSPIVFNGNCSGNACRLNYDSGTLGTLPGVYTHQIGGNISASPFTRIVKVNEIVNYVEAEIVVTVSWQTGLFAGGTKTVTLQSRIFNQYAP